MKSKYDYEIIHDYLHGLVDNKTAGEIGDLIKTDETARSIAEGIVRLEKEFKGNDAEVDKYLEDFRIKQLRLMHPKASGSSVTKKAWFGIAASFLLLIGALAVIRLMTASPDLQTLISKELNQPYPLSNLVRGEGDGVSEKAYQLYSQGDFINASIYFEQASVDAKDNASVAFYNALCYLYAGKYEKAIALFGSDGIAESRYSQQAEWYLALALLKSGNKGAATEIISPIAKDQQYFKNKEALQLLRQLE
jgi:tetratricopeptide (TPR) repeat protein